MIGRYQIKRSIGKGGMGEVLLAFDQQMDRLVALKIIRKDLLKYSKIRARFLKEARIAGRLTHPSIIPIYSIHQEEEQIYYAMPYVEGETLKEIIQKTREGEDKPHPLGLSIPALIRIFVSVCQAVSYAHSRKIIHRDLKPDNIIVGKFGEVLILDWGIAVFKDESEENLVEEEIETTYPDLTQPGKVLGTLSYLAPERALGEEASESSDIYSLGALLYFLLTLETPFSRINLHKFRKMMYHEELIDPSERAPYREIPRQLSEIAKKCLAFDQKDRYDNVKALISDLEYYIEGNPEWIFVKSLSLDQKKDWEFQENIVLARHMAITRASEMMEWAMLMISKESFSGNTKIELEITLQEECQGIGILLSIPESKKRETIEDGYRFWIGSEEQPGLKLYRCNVEVMHLSEVGLKRGIANQIVIEKIDNHVRLYLNGALLLNYMSYIPMIGAHIGLLYKDAFFSIDHFTIFEGSQNVMVGCLSIPDAFLATSHFTKALTEYRRIGYSFQGRAEGRDALFRAGITLIEKAKKEKKSSILQSALDEFEKLRSTPGAPLEYLGKSIVYQEEGDVEEEIKCLELAFRKYPKHPLQHILEEHVIFRLHQTSSKDRIGAYHFALLAFRLIPHIFSLEESKNLYNNLNRFKERLFFIETPKEFSSQRVSYIHNAIELCFWLNKPLLLLEIYKNRISSFPERKLFVQNILLSLLVLNEKEIIEEIITEEKESGFYEPSSELRFLELISLPPAKWPPTLKEEPFAARLILVLIFHSLSTKNAPKLISYFEKLQIPTTLEEDADAFHIWALLLNQEVENIPIILEKYTMEKPSLLSLMNDLFHSKTKPLPEITYPYTYELLPYYLQEKITLKGRWGKNAFRFEKLFLFKELSLFHHLNNEQSRAKYFEKKAKSLFKT